jgi:SagB-type dehydrogenase family enzyme
MPDPDPEEILRYHEATKHHPERYARSLGYMDWANQPAPFRFYEGVPALPLPLLTRDPAAGHRGLYQPLAAAEPFDREHIAGLLELSLGLSAWKSASGSRWALRMNPSSGNLHPTEAHLILPPGGGSAGGVFHYDPLHHALEQRAVLPPDLSAQLFTGGEGGGFYVGLTSIFWREAWKYGERAFRYCNHDVGHALAALRFSANLFGWGLTCQNHLGDEDLSAILGLHATSFPAADEEHPDLLCRVHPRGAAAVRPWPHELTEAFSRLVFQGRPNRLSAEHVDWEIIARAAEAARKPPTAFQPAALPDRPPPGAEDSSLTAAAIIRRRRSATAFDRRRGISRNRFCSILERTLPRPETAPFDAGLGDAALHLVIFVHQVEGLPPGLYCFIRNERGLPELRALTRREFAWTPAAPGLPLYLLTPGNLRSTAAMVSCHQEIAGESAFSLGMLARFGESVRREPFRYRQLFWESGMIGQILYLEAEACGLRGTGIGCFFDDLVHDLMGLETDAYQSLYHFTVGVPLEDPRVTTLPPYGHLKGR